MPSHRKNITATCSRWREFSDPKLLQRTLDFAVSPDVRSQDALRLISNVMHNPAGEKLAWDFIQSHWDAVAESRRPLCQR